MKCDYRLLVFGDIYNIHIKRFVISLKSENPKCVIDILCNQKPGVKLDSRYVDCFNEISLINTRNAFRGIPLLQQLYTLFTWKKRLKAFTEGKKYDIVQIHYPTCFYVFLLNRIKRITHKLVLTPWGSDVYRIQGIQRIIVRILYRTADCVTGSGDRFTKDFVRIFDIPDNKLGYANLGSDTIDYILENKDSISVLDAKNELGLDNAYVITCAYNASPDQNHLHIIDEIYRVRELLPSNTCLIFPLAYPKCPDYILNIKAKVKQYNIWAVFIEDYLDLKDLFILRQATDLFIHVQNTDANSLSLREYLLCGKKIVNGSWLKYDELEPEGITPYYVAETFSTLGDTIVNAVNSQPLILHPDALKLIINMGCKQSAKDWNNLFISIV